MASINGFNTIDYGALFSSLSGSSNIGSTGGSTSFLSEYSSIKNGSYGKLVKAYYKKNPNAGSPLNSNKVDTAEKKELSAIKADADALSSSANKLVSRGSKSLFKQVEKTVTKDGVTKVEKGYDTDAIGKGVENFVKDYNALLDSATDSKSNSALRQTLSMINITKSQSKLLSQAGITIGKDNKLSLDKEALKTTDIGTLKSLFNGSGSYAYNIESKASLIESAVSNELRKSNTYSSSGGYGSSFNSGNMYNSFY